MSTADYSDIAAEATALLAEAGSSEFKLRTRTSNAPDPAKPWRVVDGVAQEENCSAVVITEGGKLMLYLGATGLSIVPDDNTMVVAPGGATLWAIKNGTVASIDPTGTGAPILYTAELTLWPT